MQSDNSNPLPQKEPSFQREKSQSSLFPPSLSALFLITSPQRSGNPSRLLTFPQWYTAGHSQRPQGLSIPAESSETGTHDGSLSVGTKFPSANAIECTTLGFYTKPIFILICLFVQCLLLSCVYFPSASICRGFVSQIVNT